MRRWKLSPMDLESITKWGTTRGPRTRCSFTPTSPRRPGTWSEREDKRPARINCIAHLFELIPYADHDPPTPGALTPRPAGTGYVRPPIEDQTYVPPVFS